MMPVTGIEAIGAGGGSIAWLDGELSYGLVRRALARLRAPHASARAASSRR